MVEADHDGVKSRVLLRELARLYAHLNWELFGNKLSAAPLLLSDDRARLGCYRSDPRRIELSRALVLEQPWGVVVEVLKHEMAHQFVSEVLGAREEAAHGPAFQRTCERLGIDPSASGVPRDTHARSPLLERIQKLLALAGSPNQHEAEAAMRMAHRLMLKHNLQPTEIGRGNGGYGFRHLGRPTGRISEAESLLAGLLGEFFFVHPIWVSSFRVADQRRASTLEITGRHENLLMAEYVYEFLLHAAESLWREHKRAQRLPGNRDRRAFVAGVMRGFAEKLRSERKQEAAAGLVWVGDPAADTYFRRRHPRVERVSHKSTASTLASGHGRSAGRSLVIHRPLTERSSERTRLLPG